MIRPHPLGLALVVALISVHSAVAQSPTSASVPPSAREQQAAQLLQAGDQPKALAAYQDLAAAEPQNARAWFGVGTLLHDTGKYAEARDALLKAQALAYQPPNQVRFRLARTYLKLADPETAYNLLDQMAGSGFTNAPALQSPDLDSIRNQPRLAGIVARMNQNARPCESDPRFRKFDFWIGEWDVQPTNTPRAASGATSRITRDLAGCVILEHWMPPSAPEGKSFNTYNTATNQWEQYWVDARGSITHYKGAFKDDGNLYYEADQFGTTNRIRMTFFNQGPNQVRQLGHISTDGGRTWTVSFDLTYIRKP